MKLNEPGKGRGAGGTYSPRCGSGAGRVSMPEPNERGGGGVAGGAVAADLKSSESNQTWLRVSETF